jgi:phosphatidylserine/phosphatidylglycerophosphate/cardiolipin synthase-like enzyme
VSRERDIIREGETCWRRVRAGRVALLLDAANYFGALRQSMLAAEHSILLAGWDIDSRTELRGDTAPDDDGPATLGPLLSWLVRRRPKLTVRILLWDYSMLYALEREVLPRLNLDWKTPRRVQVCLDNCLPFGSSHHEKLAVIDGCIAYCGGIDLTIRRWDRPAHDPADPDRRDPDGVAYAPFHDLQLVVDGDAARALDELLRERWNRAAGVCVEAVTANSAPWPDGVAADFRDIDLGIARTRPAWRDEAELRQVEAVFVDAIGRAQRLIYIENQYLTFPGVAAALGKRLEACPNLELIIVNPDSPGGWLEAQTMGQGRIRFLARLALAGQPDRVRVLYPWVKAGADRVAVMVHAKLMIVDDRLLQLGSSNLNCRSMGVDRECDLLIEAHDAAQRRAIRAIRCRLLAHHLGLEPETLSAEIDDGAALIPWLDGLASDQRGLAALPEPEADAAPAARGFALQPRLRIPPRCRRPQGARPPSWRRCRTPRLEIRTREGETPGPRPASQVRSVQQA